ncbi:hypothetical protein [Jannaschia pohangensis]|uniref:hypothetical protein n=1 Tax=Jannaschia pohangensis TaxID=390807 RepID=UPI0011133EEB|nr:hypothetical protein [Jannaschia pohangensis]
MNSDLRNAAGLAVVENFIISEIYGTEEWKAAVSKVEKNAGYVPGTLSDGYFTQVRVLSVLYFILVFPKDRWLNDAISSIKFLKVWKIWSEKYDINDDPKRFLRHMRNSIAHGDVEFKFRKFVFRDRNNPELALDADCLADLIDTVGRFFAVYPFSSER